MFSVHDTIVAIATPPGRGGIGVVRISGGSAEPIARALTRRAQPLPERHATLTVLVSCTSRTPIDQAVVTYFPAPNSYTGEDVVELSAHGNPLVLRRIVEEAIAVGARAAAPGEFTLRAFLNGRIDLTQAEAVADLIEASTPLQAGAAFDQLQGTLTRTIAGIDAALFDLIARLEASVDFPDEGYHFVDPSETAAAIDAIAERTAALLCTARRGRLIREGLEIAIVGRPNVGKSSLFNALIGAERAIVTALAGTTRDLVTESIDLLGLRTTLVDSAGVRESTDPAERQGVERAQAAARIADLSLVVVDRSQPWNASDDDIVAATGAGRHLLVANKSDLPAAWHRTDVVCVSATTGAGIEELRRRIADALDFDGQSERPDMTNVRHIALVEQAHAALLRARRAAGQDGVTLSEEFVLADLQEARGALEEVAGRRAPDDLLAHIFERFCIGK